MVPSEEAPIINQSFCESSRPWVTVPAVVLIAMSPPQMRYVTFPSILKVPVRS
jgi:hypothetical protein